MALGLGTLSFWAAWRSAGRTGRKGGLVLAALALAVTVSLLAYNKVRFGYFM